MMAHVTAVSLTSENKTLCHPASVDNIPTSANKEDHVSMGGNITIKLITFNFLIFILFYYFNNANF